VAVHIANAALLPPQPPRRNLLDQTSPAPCILSTPHHGRPQALEVVRQRMAGCPYGSADEDTMRWFLRDRYFDGADAANKLTAMLKWRQTTLPPGVTLASVQAEYDTGKAYLHTSPDRWGRPVIVVRTKLHRTAEFPLSQSQQLCAIIIDNAVGSLPPGGEQIMGIFNLRGFGLENADFDFARFMIDAFFNMYPRRMGQILFVDAPWLFRPLWQAVKPLMRKYAALVRFVSAEEVKRDFFAEGAAPPDFL